MGRFTVVTNLTGILALSRPTILNYTLSSTGISDIEIDNGILDGGGILSWRINEATESIFNASNNDLTGISIEFGDLLPGENMIEVTISFNGVSISDIRKFESTEKLTDSLTVLQCPELVDINEPYTCQVLLGGSDEKDLGYEYTAGPQTIKPQEIEPEVIGFAIPVHGLSSGTNVMIPLINETVDLYSFPNGIIFEDSRRDYPIIIKGIRVYTEEPAWLFTECL